MKRALGVLVAITGLLSILPRDFRSRHLALCRIDRSLVSCPVYSQVTNENEEVRFRAQLGGFVNQPGVVVRANGVLLGEVPARSTDLSGDGVTDTVDLQMSADRFLNRLGSPEIDYNLDGVADAEDLLIFAKDFIQSEPSQVCP